MIPVVNHTFTPKEASTPFGVTANGKWRVRLERVGAESGFDYNLVVENPQTEASYLVEVGISRDGKLILQVVPDGGDAEGILIQADQDRVHCHLPTVS